MACGKVAITGVPTGVDGEVHDVGEASDLQRAGGLAAGQSTEGVEVDRFGTDGEKIGVQEGSVAGFVVGVALDILGAITIEGLKGELIRILSSEAKTSKFGVLLPEIGFDEFGGRGEAQKRDVSGGYDATLLRRF